MKLIKFSLGISIALSLAACSSNKSEENESVSTDTVGVTSILPTDLPETHRAKLVKTADIDFQVKDVYKSSANIHQNVKKLGGLVMNNNIQTIQIDSKTIPISNDSLQVISSYTVEAQMTVRVPSENLNDFVASVASDATLIYTAKLDIDDRGIDYLGSTLKQQSRQKILDKQLKRDTLKTDELLQLANQQEAIIDGKMSNLKTDASVRYSTISLHFTQNMLLKKEILPDNNLSAYQPPVYKRFVEALSSGLNFFLNIIIGIFYVWPFILFGFGGWMAYRYMQRRLKMKT